MDTPEGFFTFRGYERFDNGTLTAAMEDYLEMIARLTREGQAVRVGALSRLLHVQPPSVTKMTRHLAAAGYLRAEKYGEIHLTDAGSDVGAYLLYRHAVLHRFLCVLNRTESELEQVERIEHFLDRRTVEHLDTLTHVMETQHWGD